MPTRLTFELAALIAQTAAGENTGPLYALAAALASLAGALALVGKWMMSEITRLNTKLLETVAVMQASTIATNNMTEVARKLGETLTEAERAKGRLEAELEHARRGRHPEGE